METTCEIKRMQKIRPKTWRGSATVFRSFRYFICHFSDLLSLFCHFDTNQDELSHSLNKPEKEEGDARFSESWSGSPTVFRS